MAEPGFVCPWCGATFSKRHVSDTWDGDGISLEEHWQQSPECRANRNVNNPTQSKYDVVDGGTKLRLVDDEDRDA